MKIIGNQRQLPLSVMVLKKHDKDFGKCEILDGFKLRFIYLCQLSTRALVISEFDFSEFFSIYFIYKIFLKILLLSKYLTD